MQERVNAYNRYNAYHDNRAAQRVHWRQAFSNNGKIRRAGAVYDALHDVLQRACDEGKNGRESVLNFCKAYLDFSIDPDSNWLVLVRCSPYSDMKTSDDRELMFEKFNEIHKLLEQQLWRGIEDGSIRELLVKETAQILMSLVVGANRTRVLTPYAPPHLYREAIAFAARAITPCNACE